MLLPNELLELCDIGAEDKWCKSIVQLSGWISGIGLVLAATVNWAATLHVPPPDLDTDIIMH